MSDRVNHESFCGTAFGDVAAAVLLSGGMDSTACAVWASRAYPKDKVLLVGFAYGQPNRDAELVSAHALANRLGLEWTSLQPIGAIPKPERLGGNKHGNAAPIVIGRNDTFLSIACNHAVARFPGHAIDLWIGACLDDQGGFPDCRPAFFDAKARALSLAHGVAVRVIAPLIATSKRALVADADDELHEHLARSFSCYRGTVCGECTPCVLRADAFKAAERRDSQAVPKLCGGDPHRDARLAG